VTARSSLLALALLAGCQAPPKPTWHRDVAPLVQAKCGGCHYNGGVGPFPLTTHAEVVAVGESVKAAITSRRMPPWPTRRDCAEYAPDGSLSDEQIALINDWLGDGAMEGDVRDFKPLEGPKSALSRVDLALPMVKPYTPRKTPDDYRCFVLDWPKTDVTYITGFNLAPGNAAMIHHADILYVPPSRADEYRANDPTGDGWECFNPPILEGFWIGTFVPGSSGMDFPDGSGLKIEPGSKVFIQFHYNTATVPRGPDLSTLELSLESRVKKPGLVVSLAKVSWLQRDMRIPAFEKDVVHRYEEDLTKIISVFNRDFVDGLPLKAYAAIIHMHQMGSAAKFEIMRKGGGNECIVDIPKWEFHWQLPYALAAPKIVNPGDSLAIECHWDNSQENQPYVNGVQRTPREINWGPNTDDEMCIVGVYVTH